jgi:hypothetical protein
MMSYNFSELAGLREQILGQEIHTVTLERH